MGRTTSAPVSTPIEDETYNKEDNEFNGLIFAGQYLPEEMLLSIFCHLDVKTLKENCSYVCQKWYIIVMKAWKAKCLRMYPQLRTFARDNDITVKSYYFMALNEPFEKNLLRNARGEDDTKNWKIVLNGGHKWKVESPPIGVQDPNPNITSCFATSYAECQKMQVIDLYDNGICSEILDLYQPRIVISEWYAPRFDCSSVYMLHVALLNVMKKCVDQFDFKVKLDKVNSEWKQVSHIFKNYGQAVRYVRFCHSGHDSQFWAGHYGSKMSEASVIVSLDDVRYTSDDRMLTDDGEDL